MRFVTLTSDGPCGTRMTYAFNWRLIQRIMAQKVPVMKFMRYTSQKAVGVGRGANAAMGTSGERLLNAPD